MTCVDPGKATPAPAAAAAAALADWWRLSGHDIAIPARAAPWRSGALSSPPAARPRPAAAARAPAVAARAPAAAASPAPAGTAAIDTLAALEALVRQSAPRAVFADGVAESGLMLMGEAPSAEDLETGRPFTGPAGRFLDQMLAAIGRDRKSAYFTILACRQPFPGPPHDDAVAADLPFARAHIRLVRPRAMLLLGAIPTRVLTGADQPISKVRGTWLQVRLDDLSLIHI
jgi:DNA polymerase